MKIQEIIPESTNMTKLKSDLSAAEKELAEARKSGEDKEVIDSIKEDIAELKDVIRKGVASSLPADSADE